MGRITSFADIVGIIKDKASQSKAALIFNSKSLSFRLSVIRATTHDPSTPPGHRHIADLLSAGNGSRATAAAAVEAVMDRLHTTGDASVALKCLIVAHHIVKYGSFILQDQLSVFPASGGRNYLKLSSFRDDKSPLMWELSYWVRWYALYLEHLLSTSGVLGFFLSSTSSTASKDREEKTILSLSNADVLREIDAMVSLLEEACKIPDLTFLQSKALLEEITLLVVEDYLSSINELSIRISEFKERFSSMSFRDSIELVCALKRLECLKERLLEICHRKRGLVNGFWGLVGEVKGMIGNFREVYGQDGKMLVAIPRIGKGSGSARFHYRPLLVYRDSVRLSSTRFSSMDRSDFPIFNFKSIQLSQIGQC